MTLATADGDGTPWASPVWFAHEGYSEFIWASKPEARHSVNVAARPQIGIVIFDSTVPEGEARAVYVEASAERLDEDQVDRAIAVFSRRSVAQGVEPWTPDDVAPPRPHRLYRATASAHFLLDGDDTRTPVQLA